MNRYVIGNPYEETDGNGISDEQRKDMKGDGSVILSASRRTDIPNYYSGWFFNRIKEGYLYVRNPMNAHQISRILLSPEVVDCIVFWTKNPQPMLAGLDALEGYSYYFQFTLTGYGADMEPGVLHKKRCMLPIFQKLSRRLGRERVVWRYDPIIFTETYSPAYHLKAFAQIAGELHGCTEQCVISFVDLYAKNQKRMNALHPFFLPQQELAAFAAQLAEIAREHGISVGTCAETVDLSACGIGHHSCIDPALIGRITGCGIRGAKDKNQRKECGCLESIEVGTYDTCQNGCLYCYANSSPERISRSIKRYDAHSPLLCGRVTEDDKITERRVRSLKDGQLTFL
ncbi:DUF1848 domain-containing protein [Lachnospiraceae bacterium 47-T17]